jgi:hypothetical protein
MGKSDSIKILGTIKKNRNYKESINYVFYLILHLQ